MMDMRYDQSTIDQMFLWLHIVKNPFLIETVEHLQKIMDQKVDEEIFLKELYNYCEKIRVVHTEEEKKQILEEIRKRRNNKK